MGQTIDKNVISFIENVLFTTLTNVNFGADVHIELLKKSQEIKENLRSIAGEIRNYTPHASMYDQSLDPDIRSLRQTILYGLKGISAYGHHPHGAEINEKHGVTLHRICGKIGTKY